MGYFEPGDEVVFEYFRDTIHRASIADSPEHGSHSKVGHYHGIPLSLRKENGVRVEVVGPIRVSLLTRNVKYCKSIGYSAMVRGNWWTAQYSHEGTPGKQKFAAGSGYTTYR